MSTKNGWETKSPEEALSLHFMYWFTSRRNQGKVLGGVPSFYFLWAEHGKTPETMIERTKIELDLYVKELFPESEVSVTKQNINNTLTQYTLIIAARVVSDGVAYDMARAVLVTGEHYKVLDEKRLNK
jgi:hypothetical protein